MRLRSADRQSGIISSSQSLKSKNVRKRKSAKPAERKAQKAKNYQITKSKIEAPHFLEKGHIYFLYRPKVQVENVNSVEEVQRFYILLKPNATNENDEESQNRLIIIAKKHMPDIDMHEKIYAFVWKTGADINQLSKLLDSEEYDTATRGHRKIGEARPCGQGVYGIVKKENKTYLAYVLEVPETISEVQLSFNIKKEGSYLISIKNPQAPADLETAGRIWKGLSASEKAKYDENLLENFKGRLFIPTIPVSFLNHSGCEVLLIGITEKLEEKMEQEGAELTEWAEQEEEQIHELGDAAESVFRELNLDRSKFKSEALLGNWT